MGMSDPTASSHPCSSPERIVEPGSDDELLSCTVRDLQPFAQYELSVRSTGLLTGETSHVVLLHRMAEDRPGDAPGHVTAAFDAFAQEPGKGRGVALVAVQWTPPTRPNGRLAGYRLRSRQTGSDTWDELLLPDSTTRHTLSLAPHHMFELVVCAFTAEGDGPFSSAVTVETGSNVKKELIARNRRPDPPPAPPEPAWQAPSSTPAERGTAADTVRFGLTIADALRRKQEIAMQSIQFKALMHMQSKLNKDVEPAAAPLVIPPPAVLPVTGRPAAKAKARVQFAEPEGDVSAEADKTPGLDPFLVSGKGTVRGVRDRVRQQLAQLHERRAAPGLQFGAEESDIYGDLKGRVVVYTSSSRVFRETFEGCQIVTRIFHGLRYKIDQRDTFISDRFNREFAQRMAATGLANPQVRMPTRRTCITRRRCRRCLSWASMSAGRRRSLR